MFRVRVHKVQGFCSAEPQNRIAEIHPGQSLMPGHYSFPSPKRPSELSPPLHLEEALTGRLMPFLMPRSSLLLLSAVRASQLQESSSTVPSSVRSVPWISTHTGEVSQASHKATNLCVRSNPSLQTKHCPQIVVNTGVYC